VGSVAVAGKLYGWENADRSVQSGQYVDYQDVKARAEHDGLRVIVYRYEFADSEMLHDFTVPDPDAEPREGTYERAFCEFVADPARGHTLADGWELFTGKQPTSARRIPVSNRTSRTGRDTAAAIE
jgi:hypothetical protein